MTILKGHNNKRAMDPLRLLSSLSTNIFLLYFVLVAELVMYGVKRLEHLFLKELYGSVKVSSAFF